MPVYVVYPYDFSNLVRNTWVNYISMDLRDNISKFIAKVKVWNWDVFGNIFYRKKRLLERLKGVENKLASGTNDFLIKLKKNLKKEYQEILSIKEDF